MPSASTSRGRSAPRRSGRAQRRAAQTATQGESSTAQTEGRAHAERNPRRGVRGTRRSTRRTRSNAEEQAASRSGSEDRNEDRNEERPPANREASPANRDPSPAERDGATTPEDVIDLTNTPAGPPVEDFVDLTKTPVRPRLLNSGDVLNISDSDLEDGVVEEPGGNSPTPHRLLSLNVDHLLEAARLIDATDDSNSSNADLPPPPFNISKENKDPATDSPSRSAVICPVCLDTHDAIHRKGGSMMATRCGHVFCADCLTECMKKNKKCPSCRKKLTKTQIHPLYI